jgi:hypothetical protein
MPIFPRFARVMQLFVVFIGLSLFVTVPTFGAILSASPTKISFVNTPVNTTTYQYVTLTNQATDPAQISGLQLTGSQSTSFQASGIKAPLTLGSMKSITFMVKFTPTSSGNFAATLGVSSVNAATVQVALSGSATTTSPSGTLKISPSSFNFGNVAVGTTGSKTVTLTANSAAITISAATTTNQEFTLGGMALPTTIAAGKSVSLGVNFKPASSGTTSTRFLITHSGQYSPGAFKATGAGVATTQHTVGLSWSPSTTSIVGYNIYRGTATGGPYSKLNSSSIVTTSYSDTAVQSGTTYFYVTTAVDLSGAESSMSNEARAAIPAL